MNIGLYVIGFVFTVGAGFTLRQHFHRRLRQELSPSREPVTESPELAHLDSQTVRFATERGRMLEGWLVEKGIPFYPLGWYVLRYVQRIIGYRFDSIAPVDTLTRIHCPVLLVYGDELVAFLQGSRRCNVSLSSGKEILTSSTKNKTLFETN